MQPVAATDLPPCRGRPSPSVGTPVVRGAQARWEAARRLTVAPGSRRPEAKLLHPTVDGDRRARRRTGARTGRVGARTGDLVGVHQAAVAAIDEVLTMDAAGVGGQAQRGKRGPGDPHHADHVDVPDVMPPVGSRTFPPSASSRRRRGLRERSRASPTAPSSGRDRERGDRAGRRAVAPGGPPRRGWEGRTQGAGRPTASPALP